MKQTIIRLFVAMIVAVSCDPPTIPDDLVVTDNSFRCGLSVQFSQDLICHIVTIELQEGDPNKEYSLIYSLDDEIVSLFTMKDETFINGSKVDFTESRMFQLKIASLSRGEHSFTVKVVTEKYSQEITEKFDVTTEEAYADRFICRAEVNTEVGNSSVFLLNLLLGHTDKMYTMTYDIDGDEDLYLKDSNGKIIKKVSQIQFSANGLCTFTLPALRPEEHIVKMVISDENYEFSLTVNFEEPLRYPDLKVVFDANDDYLQYRVENNPYEADLDIDVRIKMRGVCAFINDMGYWDSKTMELEDFFVVRTVPDENWEWLFDLRRMVEKIRSCRELSYREEWYDGFDGYSEIIPDKDVFYEVSSLEIIINSISSSLDYLNITYEELYRQNPENYWFGNLLR